MNGMSVNSDTLDQDQILMPPPDNYNSRSSAGSPGFKRVMNLSPKLKKNMPKHKPELSKFARNYGGEDVLDEHNSDELSKNNDSFVNSFGQPHQILSKR